MGSTLCSFMPVLSSSSTCGPQTGQALGWAWKRRSAGSSILAVAGRTHREGGHGGLGAVIGDILDDGKARAAIGAVDKGVAIAPVLMVEELVETIIAESDIRRDQGKALLAARALAYLKPSIARRRKIVYGGLLHDGEHGRRGDAGKEGCHAVLFPLYLYLHPLRIVEHPARKRMAPGKGIDKGSKPHTLDDPLYLNHRPDLCHYVPRLPDLSSSHRSQPSSPSPVVQEIGMISRRGFTLRASARNLSTSNATCGRRSILFNRRTDDT